MLQDGILIDLLRWDVTNYTDRITADLRGGGYLTFAALSGSGRHGLAVEAFIPTPHAATIIPVLAAEGPPSHRGTAASAAWTATENGLRYEDFISDDQLAGLVDYEALELFLTSLRLDTARLAARAEHLAEGA